MREYEGHISLREGTTLIFIALSAMLFLQFPQFLIGVGGPAAWQVALVVTMAGLVLLLPMGALAKRFPGRGLAEIGREAAGPFLGPLFTLLVALWLFASAALTLRNFTETFLISILPDTPPSVLVVVGAACAVFASYKGIEAIGRSAVILLPLVAGGALLVLLFSLPRVDLSLIYPFWGQGLMPTMAGGLYYSSMVAEAIVLLAAGYAFRDGTVLRNSSLLGALLFGLAAMATVAVLVTVFGAPTAGENPFPLYNLARLVYLGRFFQRTEAVIITFWFFAAAIRLSLLLHAAAVSFGGALGLPLYRPLLFPMLILLVSLAMVPHDFLEVLRWDRDLLRPLGFVVLAIPLVLWLLAAVRGKGDSSHAA
ncbi:MAG: GerAB/ArcD/ProY family transporter [Bacillota bacterium]